MVDHFTQANKDQLLLSFCYFLCCVFNICKLGPAWQTIESVYNTHCDFDGYFYRKNPYYTRVNMVQLNLGPLGLPCFSQAFTSGYLELNYLKLLISNKEQHSLFLFYKQIYPSIANSQLYEQIVASLQSSRLAGFCTVQLLVLCKHRKQAFPTIFYSRIVLGNYNVFCTYFF